MQLYAKGYNVYSKSNSSLMLYVSYFSFPTLSIEIYVIYFFYISTFDFHFNILNTTTDYQ